MRNLGFGTTFTVGRVPLGAAAFALSMAAAGQVSGDPLPVAWKAVTSSPRAATVGAAMAPIVAACGDADGALTEVAARAARRLVEGGSLLGGDELGFHLRAAGDPHPYPRAWMRSGSALSDEEVGRSIRAWLAPVTPLGVRRCGVVRATLEDGSTVIAAISVDALADLSPLPTTARVGQWISLDGAMLVPATSAKVVILGPRGAPKTVPTSLAGDRVHATFSVDQPGAWVVQVLASVSTGPRPVLEAMIHAGSPPPAQFVSAAAPGESAAQGAKDDDDAMLRMINAARAAEGAGALTRDPQLDKLARVHSEEMLKARLVAHDLGTGDPATRLRAAGLSAHQVGENVATSSTVEGAHRVLWASPSHRGNLLLNEFTRIGVAVVRGANGTVWVTEMFAG